MIFLEIESYEPYHIGNKLNPATNFDTLKEKLRSKLETEGYEVPEKKIQGLIPTNEILGSKETIKIEFNNAAKALNVIGDSPEKVTKYNNELMSILETLDYEIENTISFTEVLAAIVAKSDGKPTDMLQKFMKTNVNTVSFKDVGELDIIGVRIARKTCTDKNLFTLAIEPSPTSTNSKFVITVHYRPENTESIKTFYEDLEEDIIGLIEQLV